MYAVADCKSSLEQPLKMELTAVCLIPMGLPVPSVGPQIAECQKVLEASGLEYKVRSLAPALPLPRSTPAHS